MGAEPLTEVIHIENVYITFDFTDTQRKNSHKLAHLHYSKNWPGPVYATFTISLQKWTGADEVVPK